EDGDGLKTLADLRETFGDEVAELVLACSDAFVKPKPPWRERKEQFIETMRTASPEVRLIIAADKLHNAMTTLRDMRTEGNAIWQRFNGGREGSLWVYAEMLRALSLDWQHPILSHLEEVVDTLHRVSSETGTSGD
ncbi:MAG: HD domain-containing protein, partial [Candidatus Hydrogenedentales bacterium]